MAEIVKRAKPLAVNPLKVSQPVGATLAFLGLRKSIPMLHGSQGCTAFTKVFFVRHYRDPIPLQTTALDQVAAVMNPDEAVIEGLKVICEKNKPEVIGLPTTGLTETQGTDIRGVVKAFRARHPEFAHIAVVPVHTPDYVGCMESGYALAVEAMIDTLVPETRHPGRRRRQVNVLAGSALTPGDIELLKDWIEAFGLRPVVLPDIGDSLDGHLVDLETTPLTLGGTPKEEVAAMGESIATLVIGRSMTQAADLLKERTGVPDFRFDHLMGIDAADAFTQTLATLSDQAVPASVERQRAQLQDAMVDSHFMAGFARVAVAADPDMLLGLSALLHGVGAEIVAATAPVKTDCLSDLPCRQVRVGDLEDLERDAAAARAQVVVGSSHCASLAERLGLPLLRAGFPLYDRVGAYAQTWIGYRGGRRTLFDFANLILGQHHEIPVYRSRFWQDGPREWESARPAAGAGLAHH